MRGTGLDSGPACAAWLEFVLVADRSDALRTLLRSPLCPSVGERLRFELTLVPRCCMVFLELRTLDAALLTLPSLGWRLMARCEPLRTLLARGSFRRMRRPSFHESWRRLEPPPPSVLCFRPPRPGTERCDPAMELVVDPAPRVKCRALAVVGPGTGAP